MPLEEGLLIACKDHVVELTATLIDPHLDAPDAFSEAVSQRLFEHRYLSMTDATLLEGGDLSIASVILSRKPVPDPLKDVLAEAGLRPETTEAGGRPRTGIMARFGKGAQCKLDRWRLDYARATGTSEALGVFESAVLEAVPQPSQVHFREVAQGLVRAVQESFGVSIEPQLAGLRRLESLLGVRPEHRLVLHPSVVSSLAAFVAVTVLALFPGSSFDPDEDPPLLIPAGADGTIGTDPEFRVVDYIRRGARASLADYVQSLQGETARAEP